jgi:hypothetical protein
MKRRFFLRAALVVAGAGAALGGAIFMRRGIADGRLTDSGREVLRGVALGVLDNLLPTDAAARDAALTRHVQHMETFLLGVPAALRQEISLLLGLLGNTVGRAALTYMPTSWANASVAQIQAALETLRTHPMTTQKMVYHAVRDLTTIVFLAQPENWKSAGYPGPTDL